MVVRYNGYGAKVAHPMMVGTISPSFRRAFDAVRGVFEATLAALRPGLTFGQLQATAAAVAGEQDVELDGMVMRGLGLGEDVPLPGRHDRVSENLLPLAAGMVVSFQPAITDRESGLHLGLADTVALTESGARRLGTRSLTRVGQ
jgi:Xaa-Pro aminopeptidase